MFEKKTFPMALGKNHGTIHIQIQYTIVSIKLQPVYCSHIGS